MANKRNVFSGDDKLTATIAVAAAPMLKELAGDAADKEGLPLSEWVVRLIAERLGRPDLATIPRKRPGRHRKKMVAVA